MKTLRFSRILSTILVIAMLVQIMPIRSLAASSNSNAVDVETGQPSLGVLGEVEDLREEDTKHFRMSDGSFIAVSYGMPVHYQDENGNWADIDNTITINSDTSSYQLNRSDAVVSFSNALTNGKILTTSIDGKSISMSLLDTAQAVLMIAGEEAELMGENPVVESDVAETILEDTIPETVPSETAEETIPATVTEETEAETLPEETVTETVLEEIVDEPVIETIDEDPIESTEESGATDPTEDISITEIETSFSDTTAQDMVSENIKEETESDNIPDETDEIMEPEETVDSTIPEDTSDSTMPEETTHDTRDETISEVPEKEVTNADEMRDSVAPILPTTSGISFNRNATGEIALETPTMLTLQDKYSWDMEDIIPDTLQSSLLYKDVFPGVDLLYTAFGHNIKEQIIVNRIQDAYRYDFLLELDGLTALLNENGSVSFVDSDQNQVYSIPVPYMEDEAGILSPDVAFSLNDTPQGLVLTVEASAEWINAEDREFPVKIDPSFDISSGAALDEIYSVYTMEAAPNDTTLGRQYLYVGAQPYSTSNDGKYRTFMHFNDMPDIPAGSEVIGAQLSMFQQLYNQRYCTSFPVGVYEVTTTLPSTYSSYYDWFSKMTWRTNMPAYDTSNVIDYVMVDATKCYRQWDITELVKKWYIEGTSNSTCALIMMNEDEIDTYYYYASATFLAYASSIPPVLIVSYRNNTGIEPYYTYATLGAASAGTAYIADATGQLKVGKELVSYASSTNPFSLNLVYNSDYFALASGTDYLPPSKLGLSMNVGSGWTLNYIQKVESVTIDSINYLKYTDGDGTIHYFLKDSTPDDSNYPYYDEDGLGLKMNVNSTNNYTMADDNGNVWIFTNNYLTSVQDSDGNKININYSSGRISSITQVNKGQSAIEVASFTYNSNKLTTVEDAAGNTFTLTYSGSKLASIQKNSSTIATYSYDGYRLTKMTDSESSYALSFTYSNGKISSYKEMGGTTTGATVTVTYPSHSQTTYRDYGADRSANTSDDILTHYLFDYAGRTVNAYTTDKEGNVLGATNAVYSANSSISKTNNRTLRSASTGVVGQQLLRNTGIESTSNAWTFSGTSRSSTNPRTGSYSIKGTLSNNGTIYAQKSSESLTAGSTYVLSCYVNTTNVTSFSGYGAYVKVTDSSGNAWSSYSVNYATSSAIDDGWVQISIPFTAKVTGAHTITIYFRGAIGTFYADDFQLEKGISASSYNLVENGSMQMSSHGWTMGSLASIDTSKGAAGSTASLKIIGDPEDTSANAYQDIGLKLPGTQTYILSGWVYANAVPDNTAVDNATDTNKQCGLRAILYYSDNTTESHYISFNSNLSNVWQFTSTSIVPKAPSKTVTKIRIVCAYEGNANVAYFDNISLLREPAQTMKYDSNGNLISVTTPGLNAEQNTYSGANLMKTVTGGNGTYTYTYDSTYTHRLKSVSNGQLTQSFGYDGTGNVTSTTLSGTGSTTISTSATYGGSSNRLTSITDATGSTVQYGYNNADVQMMALPTTMTDPKGSL